MWKVTGASVAGTLHEAAKRGCDDASAWSVDTDLACLAVADGAGSRPLSGQGAARAVERALSVASACARGPGADAAATWLPTVFADVREQLRGLAAEQGRALDDYATTLAVVILTPNLACVGQVGDTLVVVASSGTYQTIAPSPPGEYVNETTFVTEERALDLARITVLPAADIEAVFLSTDGLRFKILDDPAAAVPFAPFFDDLTAYVRAPGASSEAIRGFLAGLRDDQTGDDKTLVAAVRNHGSAGAQPSGVLVPRLGSADESKRYAVPAPAPHHSPREADAIHNRVRRTRPGRIPSRRRRPGRGILRLLPERACLQEVLPPGAGKGPGAGAPAARDGGQ